MSTIVRADSRDLRELLERVAYEPAERGPLLAILPGRQRTSRNEPSQRDQIPSLQGIAAMAGRKVVRAGAVTVLAPERMILITDDPGKANPFAGMDPIQILDLFLASLTEGQWQLAAGKRGIGMADLTPDQQPMYGAILPATARILTRRLEADPNGPPGLKQRWVDVGESQEQDPAELRMRLKRSTAYRFYSPDGKLSPYGNSVDIAPRIGDTERILLWNRSDAIQDEQEEESSRRNLDSTAYGVALRKTVLSRLKPSQLNYAAPALNAVVPLTPNLKTVRDVLSTAGQQTGLELHADRRIADLPIYLRAAPNQTARVGDLLMALAHAITGAYRRIDGIFLLTDDIEGIGTRYARLRYWAIQAEEQKQRLLESPGVSGARPNPLAYVEYDANTPDALPEDLHKKVEANWMKSESMGFTTFNTASLPSGIQREIEHYRRYYAESKQPVVLDASRVGISFSLDVRFLLPDGSEVRDGRYGSAHLLSRILGYGKGGAATPSTTQLPAPSDPKPLVTARSRSVVLCPAVTAGEATALVTAAKQRGMTEVWLDMPLLGAEKPDTAPLAAAIAAGKKAGIAVYAVVSLLKGLGVGTPERNILGQEGNALGEDTVAFYTRLYASRRDKAEVLSAVKRGVAKYRDWIAPDTELVTVRERQIRAIAATAGLSGITLRHTAGPGYGGGGWGDGLLRVSPGTNLANGHLGYTPAQRLAFLRQEGYDPVDIAPSPFFADSSFSTDLPFFPTADFQIRVKFVDGRAAVEPSPWNRFREARNRELLATLYTRLRKAHPGLPLFIDDRASSYQFAETSWYGSWDAADRLPKHPALFGGDPRSAARFTSTTVLLLYTYAYSGDESEEANRDPAEFARTVARFMEVAAKDWNGLVVDLSEVPGTDCLRLLEHIARRP